ncbi:RNA polymerase II mediator complex subunit [Aspergillus turcosus]|uniref:Mediator of RNA polymerase II transcription subunit 10 n=1 Tax=Aspergillus turcosus TaxID=1245748 RepID=A0A421CY94_9EURO|nr:RNA polymerase II mediator complex subunit [Aspergillus turcosus]
MVRYTLPFKAVSLTKTDDLKEVIQHLFEIQSAVHGYLGPETQTELVRKMYSLPSLIFPSYHNQNLKLMWDIMYSKNLTLALSTLSTHTKPEPQEEQEQEKATPETSTSAGDPLLKDIQLPPEIIDYVDAARNPDIYTREFVELVQRGNQDLKGKKEAFASFRDVLAREMRSAMPECRGEVERVLAATSTGGPSPSTTE